MRNVTNNCNMTCDACLSGAYSDKQRHDTPGAQLVAALPDARARRRRPQVVFFGGEPTLHEELPFMIGRAKALGYVPRLASNGLKLRDPRYVNVLVRAGLEWVVLHFDSLDDASNLRLRGRRMREACERALATCRSAGLKLQLAVTVSSENLHELYDIVRFARRHGVFWVSLYPVAEIARPGSNGFIYLTDVLDALERQTEGAVRRADFLAAARLMSCLHRFTGRVNLRQKPTMVSLPMVVGGERFVPVTRLLSPVFAARNLPAVTRLARSVVALVDYENRTPSGDTLVVNVQQFQGRSAFDLEEAVHNHMSYASDGSFFPFDIYNHVHRYAPSELRPAATLVRRAAPA